MKFNLLSSPPAIKRAARGQKPKVVPIFEPYEESLPLQSGTYSFVIDSSGNFRVKFGLTSSHASMVDDSRAGAAGRFRVNRMGRVFEVICQNTDFPFFFATYHNSSVKFIVDAFRRHGAFKLHPDAVFTFFRARFDSWRITGDGLPVGDYGTVIRDLLDEGLGETILEEDDEHRLSAYAHYTPVRPPILYPLQTDQLVASLEEYGDLQLYELGNPIDRLSPRTKDLRRGKNNFVIDTEGWLIVGPSGHHLISGGREVGGAGHIYFGPDGVIDRLDLNFSGHYRPQLTSDYARYIYNSICRHPLLKVSPDCTFSGRCFRDCDAVNPLLSFTKEELESDDPDLDLRIESAYF